MRNYVPKAPRWLPTPTIDPASLADVHASEGVLFCKNGEHTMFAPLARKFNDWRLRRIAIRKLHTLDDRLLADLGTRRDQIDCFVQDRSTV